MDVALPVDPFGGQLMVMAWLMGMAAILATAAAPPDRTGPVVFVCEHGSAKSVVAAAQFNRIAAQKGLAVRAVARGTAPEAAIAPAVVNGLRGDGLAPVDPAPIKLAQTDLDSASVVVAFGDIPAELHLRSPIERWEVPAVSVDYPASRDAIVREITKLLEAIAQK